MAAFRFRVVTPKGRIAGFADPEHALEFAQKISATLGAYVTVLNHTRGCADVRVAEFMKGEAALGEPRSHVPTDPHLSYYSPT